MQLYKFSLYCFATTIVAIALLSGCQKQQAPLRVALLEWPPYELAFWARENNYFSSEQVTLLEYKTPAVVSRAFATGAVDIIAVTSDFALALMEDIPETRLFIVIDASNGGDTVLSKQPMKKGDSFKGKRIGFESGPLASYMLARFKEKFSINDDELKSKFVDIPGQIDMWEADEIDLLITYDPIRNKLKSQGAYEIFSSREIPNEIIDVFVIRAEAIETQKENLKAFVGAWFKAVDELHAQSPELIEFIGARENLSPSMVRDMFKDIYVPSYSENVAYLSGNDEAFIGGFKQHEQIMLEQKMMKNVVDKHTLITNKALLLLEKN